VTLRPTFDVAIVGGGASGTLLAIALLRRAPDGFRLLLVDRGGDFARGIAYRTEEPSHILNVTAERMSALADEEGHFLAWLRRRDPSAGPDTYAVRHLYGDYLGEVLSESQTFAPGVVLERRQADVRDVVTDGYGLLLRFDAGPEVRARRAVLALGNPPPAPLPVAEDAHGRVRQSPWPREADWPAREASVLLVGAGLTAVDWVLALTAHGHQGRLHLLSRHGLLPKAHVSPAEKPLQLPHLPRGRIRPLVRALRQAALEANGRWRPAVDAVRPLAEDLWRSMGDAERRRFARHVRTQWETHRHRLAPEAAVRLDALRASGQLQVHGGRLLALRAAGSGVEAQFRPRGFTAEERLLVDVAVNCTGPEGHAVHPDALVSALLTRGLVRPGPLSLGLSSDAEGALLDAAGESHGRLFTLGPVRRGNHWESTAVPDIRQQAAALAKRLTGDGRGRPATRR
jgi:uncharacterized NAD(P)/FAD-binding protein YdhS